MYSNWEQLVFTKACAARILGTGRIIRLEVWANCVWVKFTRTVKGAVQTIARFVSKKLFLARFASDRRERSESVAIAQNGSGFLAQGAESRYQVTLSATGVACQCQDYQNQISLLGRGVCKHGYAALRVLGFGSLSEYLAS